LDLDEVAMEHEPGLKHTIPDSDVFSKFCGEYPRYISILSLSARGLLSSLRLRTARDPKLFRDTRLMRAASTIEPISVPSMTPMEHSPPFELSSRSVCSFGHANSGVHDSGPPAWESTLNVEESSNAPSTPGPTEYSAPSPDGSVILGTLCCLQT